MAAVFDDVFFFPCIFRVAIGNSESQIEKRQVEKCKVLPLQGAGGGTPQEQNAAIQEEKEHEAVSTEQMVIGVIAIGHRVDPPVRPLAWRVGLPDSPPVRSGSTPRI